MALENIQPPIVTPFVNDHVAAVDNHLLSTPAPENNLKSIWPVVKPVLLFIEGILFFKPVWRDAIKMLIAALDVELTDTNTPA